MMKTVELNNPVLMTKKQKLQMEIIQKIKLLAKQL